MGVMCIIYGGLGLRSRAGRRLLTIGQMWEKGKVSGAGLPRAAALAWLFSPVKECEYLGAGEKT